MPRKFRRRTAVLVCLILVAGVSAKALAQDDPAVIAISTALDIERALLDEDRESFKGLASNRRDISLRWARIHNAIDSAAFSDEPGAAAALERLTAQLEKAEGERAELRANERVLVELIRDRLRRIPLLELRLAELDVRPKNPSGQLDGSWEVVLLPLNQRGVFDLRQSGAIVTGTYRLSGGFSGSLRGTLVRTKLYLERIDSRLGRSMEFEGRVSTDGLQIKGTWLSYELAAGEGANGHWAATRQEPGSARDGSDDGG